MWRRFWNDDAGWVFSTELILISTVAILGAIVGLASYRDHVVQEFGDAGAAINALNQSYGISITGTDFVACGTCYPIASVNYSTVFGTDTDCSRVTVNVGFNNFFYDDATDVCEVAQAAGGSPACIQLGVAPIEEQ